MYASALRRILTEASSSVLLTRRLRYLHSYSPRLARIVLTLGAIRKRFENCSNSYRLHIPAWRNVALSSSCKSKNTVYNLSYLSPAPCFIARLTLISKANKMHEIIDTVPADVDALIAKLQRTYIDASKDQGGVVKGKGRERTMQGALAELQL